MIIKCDNCNKNMSNNILQRRYKTENKSVIIYSYLKCSNCMTEHDVGFDNDNSTEIKTKIKRYLNMKSNTKVINELREECKTICLLLEDELKSNNEFVNNKFRWENILNERKY